MLLVYYNSALLLLSLSRAFFAFSFLQQDNIITQPRRLHFAHSPSFLEVCEYSRALRINYTNSKVQANQKKMSKMSTQSTPSGEKQGQPSGGGHLGFGQLSWPIPVIPGGTTSFPIPSLGMSCSFDDLVVILSCINFESNFANVFIP